MFPETMPRDLQTSLSSKSAGELLLLLKLKKDARVMSTTDIVVNGQFGTVYNFGFIN